MNTQWGKKIVSVNNIEKVTTIRFVSSVKMYKNLNKVYIKPADLTFIITKKRTPKINVDGRGTSSHGKKTFRNGPVVKQEGMVFGFRKTVAAVTRPER